MLMDRDNITKEIFNTSLEVITNRMKEILYLLDDTTIVSNKSNCFNVLELKNELNSIMDDITKILTKNDLEEIKLIRFSMVVYHKVMNIIEYLNSNIKYGVLDDDINIKVLNSDDNQIYKVYNSIEELKLCIDKLNN